MAIQNLARGAQLGAKIGGLAGPTGSLIGAGVGTLAAGAYDMFTTSPEEEYQQRLKKRIRDLEGKELGLTDEEMSLYRQSMNAPAIEAAAAAQARRDAALASGDRSVGGDVFRQMGDAEKREADALKKTEHALMVENEKAALAQQRELDRLYAEQAGLQEDPTEAMLAFADEVEYQVQGAAQEAALNESMLQFLKDEGLDGTAREREDALGFVTYLSRNRS
jgi:hypothetical protein